jgi:hypothetical protein
MTIAQAQISNASATTILTATENIATTTMIFCNVTASPATLTVYLLPDGNTVDDGNTIIKTLTIIAYDTYVFDTSKLLLGLGDSIRAISNTNNAITATITYIGV